MGASNIEPNIKANAQFFLCIELVGFLVPFTSKMSWPFFSSCPETLVSHWGRNEQYTTTGWFDVYRQIELFFHCFACLVRCWVLSVVSNLWQSCCLLASSVSHSASGHILQIILLSCFKSFSVCFFFSKFRPAAILSTCHVVATQDVSDVI